MDRIKVKIERIVPEGKGLGFSEDEKYVGKAIYVLGAYPGETVLVEKLRQKKDFIEAKLIEVLEASPNRIKAIETHHTAHSPWQTITYPYQIELKRDILRKCFHSLAATDLGEDLEFFESPKKLGYRTKLEFSFDEEICHAELVSASDSSTLKKIQSEAKNQILNNSSTTSQNFQDDKTLRKIYLAFHERGSHKKMLRLNFDQTDSEEPYGCSLGNEKMNDYAKRVLDWINESGLEEFDLKSLTVRYSKYEDKVIGLLTVKNERERVQKTLKTLSFPRLSKARESGIQGNLQPNLVDSWIPSQAGNDIDDFTIALSDHRSPLAKIDKVLYQNGDDFLIEEICGLKFKYYLDSFFQNNIEAFDNTIELIKSKLSSRFMPEGQNTRNSSNTKLTRSRDFARDDILKILELYSGVGTIGMHFCGGGAEVTGVEVVESATRAAAENTQTNKLTNYKTILLPSEKIDSALLENIDILIVDPPRTGLHPKVIKMIQEKLPPQIIYLSCNPITQASDFNLIKDFYQLEYIAGMDYYPNTPHLESLAIIKLKGKNY